jgi:uncharacterized protein
MITEGYLARHTPAGRGRRGPALLDIVQDYALAHLHDVGLFDLGVVLKGGTSLRKFRAGAAGRFSTDLDFVAPDDMVLELIFDGLNGSTFHEVSFSIDQRKGPHGRLQIDTPLGRPDIPGKIDVSTRPLWLPTTLARPIQLPVHKAYEFALPPMPLPAYEEAIAEKLAAWRRRRKQRDLYDLYWFAQSSFNEALVRRLTVLKIWHDVVIDRLDPLVFDVATLTTPTDTRRMPSEEIGLLTRPIEPAVWMANVAGRYAFLDDLDETERQIVRCLPSDRYLVSELVRTIAD